MNLQTKSEHPCAGEQPPPGYVRLADVAPGIVQDMRYAGPENFMGRPVPGYRAPCCWLRAEAAAALKSAHEEAAAEGLRLVVYDCYRPPAATAAFLAWSQDGADEIKKADYYPHIDKKDLFDLGYIARQSTHTTGLAVDLAFDGFDFGTPFDLFDETLGHCRPCGAWRGAEEPRSASGPDDETRFRKPPERMVALHLQGCQRS